METLIDQPPDGTAELDALLSRALVDTRADDPAVIAKARRGRRRRRIAGGVVALVIVAAFGTYIPLTLLAPLPEATLTLAPLEVPPGPAAVVALPTTGSAAVSISGAEAFAALAAQDGILASTGGTDPLPIASITKLVTAMVILDAKPLVPGDEGPTVTFSEADSDLYDDYYVQQATVQPMRAGSSMSQHDALELMLVASASNYADALSTWAFGSRAGFLAATKVWIAERGLTGTTIVEPTGISARNTSTLVDLISLGRLATADAVIAEIVASPALQVAGFSAANNNDIVGSYGITGIKTGTLEAAGSCLLFSATLDVGADAPISVIGVALGGASRESVDAAVVALLESLKGGFRDIPTTTAGQVVGRYTTLWGDSSGLVTADDSTVFTYSDAAVSAELDIDPLTTGLAGTTVGAVSFLAETDSASTSIELAEAIREPDEFWRLTHPFELLGR